MKIYIVLTDTGSMLTKAIKLYTKKPYNHVSISFDEELTEIYSFGRKMPNNPFVGGFVKEDLNAQIFKNADSAIYHVEVSEDQYQLMIQKVREIECEKERYRYNLLGLLAIMAHFQMHRDYAYFCSQFVATVLQEAGINVTEKPPCFTTPNDIQRYAQLNLIHEGLLREYLYTQRGYDSSFEEIEKSFLGSWLRFL